MDTETSRVDFASLFGAVNRPHDEYNAPPSRSESRVSIIEMEDNVVSLQKMRNIIYFS